jgi:hypothetical protein
MPSVKLRPDTVAILAGLRGRLGCGHSYDKLIWELVRRHIDGTTSAVMAGDRLERLESMTTKILMHLEASTAPIPKKFTVE